MSITGRGSKIYCLDSDGGKGEYASKEMIQTHEGLFGMELQMWERIRDQNLDYADEDFGAFQEPMSVIDQDDALINDRPYKRKYEPEEAIQMISNGECGAIFQSADAMLSGGSKIGLKKEKLK